MRAVEVTRGRKLVVAESRSSTAVAFVWAVLGVGGAFAPLLLAGVACDATPAGPEHEWPIACSVFPPSADPVAHCARLDAAGEIEVRPGLVADETGSRGAGAILVDGELFFALSSGKTAPALVFDNGPDYFVEGLARTVRGGKIGFVNEELEVVVPREWDFAFPFENGVARVCTGCTSRREEGDEHFEVIGGTWGYVDREGRVVLPAVHPRDELPSPPVSETSDR